MAGTALAEPTRLGSDYRHITYDERARPGRGEIYGDPDPSTGDSDVDVFWSLVAT